MTDVALVLQGGAALGAFEAGAIEAILGRGWNLKIVSGVSIGAVNAAVLSYNDGKGGSDKALAALRGLWEDLAAPPFGPRFWTPKMWLPLTPWDMAMHWSVGTPEPLRETLRKYVVFEGLSKGHAPRCIVTATNLVTGVLQPFDSEVMELTPDHVVASASLPGVFPPCEIKTGPITGTFVDGGLYNNTPLKQVIDALEGPPAQKVDYIIVVNLFPNEGRKPRTLREYADRLFEIALSNKIRQDVKHAERVRAIAAQGESIRKLAGVKGREASAPDDQAALPYLDKPVVFDQVIEITYTSEEPLEGPLDFSMPRIKTRWATGFEVARDHLKEFPDSDSKIKKNTTASAEA